MIRAEHIVKSFDGRVVLDDISAEFSPGITNLIIGQSGSGKTVLLKSLVGLHKIDSGSIYYDAARKQELCAALEAGDADRLSRIPRGGSTSGVLLTLYATGSGSFAMAQVLEYVPHAFEPVTEVVLFSAEQGRAVAAML